MNLILQASIHYSARKAACNVHRSSLYPIMFFINADVLGPPFAREVSNTLLSTIESKYSVSTSDITMSVEGCWAAGTINRFIGTNEVSEPINTTSSSSKPLKQIRLSYFVGGTLVVLGLFTSAELLRPKKVMELENSQNNAVGSLDHSMDEITRSMAIKD
ncbi:hypothetical protein Tco_1112509 [Tanacetum coccineum]|uniref:Uncharacterized protein n=1 Tax=Tanacetum coccineum TaxID=301880 RepID=A0ABQ5IPK4_9ASTR